MRTLAAIADVGSSWNFHWCLWKGKFNMEFILQVNVETDFVYY